jgi:hypothetical protein
MKIETQHNQTVCDAQSTVKRTFIAINSYIKKEERAQKAWLGWQFRKLKPNNLAL